jgi:hypothetical protein
MSHLCRVHAKRALAAAASSARSLGLNLSREFLLVADEVIE